MKLLVAFLLAAAVTATSVVAVASTPSSREDVEIGLQKINAVDLPGWRLHFGAFEFPTLNKLQEAKLKIQQLQNEIDEHQRAIAAKSAEIDRVARASGQYKSSSYFMLGLYGRKTLVEDHRVVYDEKSFLWGAVKWGKQKR
jgi:hypothetical protein